ncbi:MAG: response regulator [Deltaproteobacteria bacterium]|nr:response regulator [Deltaproteobacteria bacterium]
MDKKILVVDDERDIVELIAYHLDKEGFTVLKAYDGQTAVELTKTQNPALIILDLMLPVIQGLDVCRIIRSTPSVGSVPIIMLTAKGEEVDRIIGLEIGADDYITKPFSVRELIARVRAVLRRLSEIPSPEHTQTAKVGDLDIHYSAYEVYKKGEKLLLSPTELKLLFFFTRHPGRVYTRNQILDHVWGDDTFVTPRTVDVHIRRLRSRIENDFENPEYILTVRGAGYKFTEMP